MVRLLSAQDRYDPIDRARVVYSIVCRSVGDVEERKYYRFRGGLWYGGIATADCVGCNLLCRFCWGWRTRDRFDKVGSFYSPQVVAEKLISIARRYGYRRVRISGGEPTISRKHLIQVLQCLNERVPDLLFILETNGVLIGADPSYARELAQFKNIHVRVSLKGCCPEEFELLTGARKEFFEYQLRALKYLLDAGVPCHPAVMISFSTRESMEYLISKLMEIDERLVSEVEEEYVILYPHVLEIMKRYGLKPRVAIRPNGTVVKS
ncbi:MAG: molybdenum cofactor biosynthesis protein MoaA [Thermoprotei archaeon]|nr:MAG: molybdenum cofactor biosynthesis protein MoaA [Thermoprotei archaeon]